MIKYIVIGGLCTLGGIVIGIGLIHLIFFIEYIRHGGVG